MKNILTVLPWASLLCLVGVILSLILIIIWPLVALGELLTNEYEDEYGNWK